MDKPDKPKECPACKQPITWREDAEGTVYCPDCGFSLVVGWLKCNREFSKCQRA